MIENINIKLERITNPKKGDIVFQRLGDVYIIVQIIKGKLYGEYGGICNYWYYYNLASKQIESGYGCFYKAVIL